MDSNSSDAGEDEPGVFRRGIRETRKNKQHLGEADVFNIITLPPSVRCLFVLLSKQDLWPGLKNGRGRDGVGGHRHHLHPKHVTGCQTEVKSGQVHPGQPRIPARCEGGGLLWEHTRQQVVAHFYAPQALGTMKCSDANVMHRIRYTQGDS